MASRKEQKERLRQERLQREAEATAAAQRRRLFGYVAGGVLVVAAVAAIVLAASGAGGGGSKSGKTGTYPKGSVPAQKITNLDAAAKAAHCVLLNPPDEGNQHVT